MRTMIAAGYHNGAGDGKTTTLRVCAPSEATELWRGPTGGRAVLEVSRGPLELWSWTLEPGESHLSDAHHPGAGD